MPTRLMEGSIRDFTDVSGDSLEESLVFRIGSFYDKIPKWGEDWQKRDRELRNFWLEESFLTSSVFSIAAARAAFGWTLSGPPRTVRQVQKILQSSEFGQGWATMQLKVAIDVLTQDNGAFVEVIRSSDSPASKVIGLAHIDSSRCVRTGNPEYPVLYAKEDGTSFYKLPWYSVMTFEDFPHPGFEHKGRQVSFLSRVLEVAKLIKSVTTHNDEKITGRFHKALHIVSGVTRKNITQAQRDAEYDADSRGLTTITSAAIIPTLDPNTQPKAVSLNLAELPENFNEDELFKRYITLIAMAAGGEYQDFSPLPGGSLGSSEQSEILHRKAQRKGHALWMKLWEHKLQYHKIIPKNVTFSFHQQDTAAALEQAKLTEQRVTTRRNQIESGEITISVARQLAVDSGDITVSHLALMDQRDRTAFVSVDDSDPDVNTLSDSDLVDNGEEKSLILDGNLRFEAAAWITKLISLSPLSEIMPLHEYQLKTFEFILAREMRPGTITFGEYWYDKSLVYACTESGLMPHVLKQYLPINYRLHVTRNRVFDDKDTIYVLPERKDTPTVTAERVSLIQQTKDNSKYTPYYKPLKGWFYAEDEDEVELVGSLKGIKGKTIQYNFQELLTEFKNNIDSQEDRLTYFFTCLSYSILLSKNRTLLAEEDSHILRNYMSRAKVLIQSEAHKLLDSLLIQAYFEAKY